MDNIDRVELNTPQTPSICSKVPIENITKGTDPSKEDSSVDIELKEAARRVGVGRVEAINCQLNLQMGSNVLYHTVKKTYCCVIENKLKSDGKISVLLCQ